MVQAEPQPRDIVYSLLGPRGCDGIDLTELAQAMGFDVHPLDSLESLRRIVEDGSKVCASHCLLVCKDFISGNPVDLMVQFQVRQIYLPIILLRPQNEQETLPFVHLVQLSPPIDEKTLASSLKQMLDLSRNYNRLARANDDGWMYNGNIELPT